MDIQRAIGILKEHNQWRRDNSDKMIDPTIIGEAIDCVVGYYDTHSSNGIKNVSNSHVGHCDKCGEVCDYC